MRSRPRHSQWLVFACVFAMQAQAGEEPRSMWEFGAGYERDDVGSARTDFDVYWVHAGGTSAQLTAARTVFDTTQSSASGSLGLAQAFGVLSLGAGARLSDHEDTAHHRSWLANAAVDLSAWRIKASYEQRTTDFEPLSFSADAADFGLGSSGSVSGTAECELESSGSGLSISWNGEAWSWYARGTTYDYEEQRCVTELVSTTTGGTRRPINPAARGVLTVQAGTFARGLVRSTVTTAIRESSHLAPADSALLDTSIALGTTVLVGERSTLGLEWQRTSEEFASNDTDVIVGLFGFQFSPRWWTELSLGHSRSDVAEASLFAGMRISLQL